MYINGPSIMLSLGSSLDQRERTSVAAYVRFDRVYQEFVAELQPAHVQQWDRQITAYEADTSLPDPYHWKPAGTSSLLQASTYDILMCAQA